MKTYQPVFAKVICELIHNLPNCLIVRQGKDMFRLPKQKISRWDNLKQNSISVMIEDSFCTEFGLYEIL